MHKKKVGIVVASVLLPAIALAIVLVGEPETELSSLDIRNPESSSNQEARAITERITKKETTTISTTKTITGVRKLSTTEKITEESIVEKKTVSTTRKKTVEFPVSYSDESCSITVERKWYEDAWCYIAKLKFSEYDRFGTSSANGTYLNGYETTSHFAERCGAVFAVNGDYSCPETGNTSVRSGIVNTDKTCCSWLPAIYNSNTGVFNSPTNLGITGADFDTLVKEGKMTDTFSFWAFSVVKDGEVVEVEDSARAQRTLIGSNGNAGEIIVVVSEGRYVDGESAGLTYKQCGRLMKELGCTIAVPLDGGGSSTMYFNGKVLNSAKGNERAVRDFVYFK